jgi:hypothetical protein
MTAENNTYQESSQKNRDALRAKLHKSCQEIKVYKINPVYNHPLPGHSFTKEATNKGIKMELGTLAQITPNQTAE